MIGSGEQAGDDFEKIANRKFIDKQTDRLDSDLDIYRFDFATKVAQGLPLDSNDLFSYLDHYSDVMISYRTGHGEPTDKYLNLKKDCFDRSLSKRVLRHLKKRVWWAEDALAVAERMNLKLTAQAMLGKDSPEDIVHKVDRNISIESANQVSWLPYEVKGLKECLEFFPKKQANSLAV